MGTPRETHILVRGDFLRPGAPVEPHTLEVLPPLQSRGEKPDRLDLAAWLVDPKNPLTARVTVNRVWSQLFGRGLVASVADFGTQGDKPSHAELLDWLAADFQRDWSFKGLVRRIVTSATYRQSSKYRQDLHEVDPLNVLLARQRRMRVEAEVVRDLALAASGLMVDEIGGPSVRPRQPESIAKLTYAGGSKWVDSTGPDRFRRGLYTWFQRTSPYPMLMTFDAPDSNVACTRRERSNTPLQALTLLNDPAFFECAQALGKRIVKESPADRDARLSYAMRLCVGREPDAEELDTLGALFDEQLQLMQGDSAAAREVVGGAKSTDGRPRASGDLPEAELAAWIMVGRTTSEPRRIHHAGITAWTHDKRSSNALGETFYRPAPAASAASRWRRCCATTACSLPNRRAKARSHRERRTSRPKPSRASSFSSKARRAKSICSIRSQSSTSSTGKRSPSR